jgi:putative DNA primase/helicase
MAANPNVLDRLAKAETIAPRLPKPTFPANYAMTSAGLTYRVDDDVRLIAGPFEVLAQTRDKHNQAWGVLLRWTDDDDKAHQLAVARSLLAGDGREVRQALLDGGLHVSPVTKDRNALQAFLSMVRINRRARAVSCVGWQDGCFALPDRTIDAGAGDLVVYQGSAMIDHDYRAAGNLKGWQKEVARWGIGNSRIAIALCAGFVGPLLAVAGGESGGLHFRGASSIGKSTALLAAASIWGPPAFVRQWRATANGLEGIAEQSNETLLILDELAQLDPREAGSIAYLLANGCGKSRASQTGEARAAKRWLTFFLSSGEISLAEHARSDGRGRRSPAGQEVRIIDVEADAGGGLGLFDTLAGHASGDAFARAIKEGAARHYGIAGPKFALRLLGKVEGLGPLIQTGIDTFARQNLPGEASGQVARACRRFGLLAMAGEIAAREGILPWSEGEATRAAGAVFASWLAARGGAGAAEDAAAIDQVAGFIAAHGASRFQPSTGEAPTIVHNRAGFWREVGGERQYIFPAPNWRDDVCRGLNMKAVTALLLAKGYLVPDGSGKASVSLCLPGMGKKARCYVLRDAICGSE